MRLRQYQIDCVDSIKQGFKGGTRQLVQLPTGAGKAVILWSYLKDCPGRALIVAPTRELTEQLYETGCDVVGVGLVYLKRGSYFPKNKHVIITTQALAWILKRKGVSSLDFDTLVIDEAHRAQAKTYRDFIGAYSKEREFDCLGLTATPERADGKSLLELFEFVSYKKNLLEMIEDGWLTDIECYKVQTGHEMKNVRYFVGDFNAASLNQLDVESRNKIILRVCKERCAGKKTLIFCLNVAHSIRVASVLRDAGFRSEAVYGKLNRKERSRVLKDFREGRIDFLTNCQLLTEGFDEPSIEALVLARPTKSKGLYCQMIGRGVRLFPGKKSCYVYDLSDENHNICTFNVLVGVPENVDLGLGDGMGERITSLVKKHALGELKVVEYLRHDVLGAVAEPGSFEHQKSFLKGLGVPFVDRLNFHESAYLIWKTRRLEKYGFDPRAYWKKWEKRIPRSDKKKGT